MNQPLYIIKVGGNIIDDKHKLDLFLGAFSALKGNKILVHGGGKMATKMAENLKRIVSVKNLLPLNRFWKLNDIQSARLQLASRRRYSRH